MDFIEFLKFSHQVPWNDGPLKVCFWSGLDNYFQLMPVRETTCTLAQYTEYALRLCGFSLTIDEVEDHIATQLQPSQPTPRFPISTREAALLSFVSGSASHQHVHRRCGPQACTATYHKPSVRGSVCPGATQHVRP